MNPLWQEALQRAQALTRAGRLSEATAAIQQALQRGASPAPAARPPEDVIDVEARELAEARPAAPGPARTDVHEPPAGPDLPPPGSFSAGSHHCSAGGRDYKLYRPQALALDGRPPALIVMLHGCTQDPDDFAIGTRMNALANARGWWVLYPAQSRSANSSGCWNWFKTGDQQRQGGEPEILADMAASLVARHRLDPGRVFVAGLSAGGAMAATLGATHPELFAAVGVHSGLPHGSAHDLMSALGAMRQGASGAEVPRRLRTIVFHGDQDKTVHPCNGEAVVRQAQTGSTARPPGGQITIEHGQVPGGHRYTRSTHRGADGRADTEHWLIHGAGHAWSGGHPTGSYTDPLGPDASAEMLRFFSE